MNKVLFLDLEFHIKTHSSNFLYELLEENFEVDKYFVGLDGKINNILVNRQYYDYLILFQVMPERESLEIFSYGKGVLFPMYDGVVNLSIEAWNEYKDFLIINFSKTLNAYLLKHGFEAKYIQYFPKPHEIKTYGEIDKLFFWQRTNQIHINQMLSICKNLDIKKIHIHKALDPGFYYINVNKKFQYEISTSEWLPDKEDLLDIISKAAYYVAPRKYEGIGMSFLDAMAMGRCVIAPNYPTMNEYIENGINGILFDYENPVEINSYDVRKLQKNAYEFIQTGSEKWTTEKYKIVEWIETRKRKSKIQSIVPKLKNKQKNIQEDKYYVYYMLMNRWMLLKNNNINLGLWFKDRGVKHIAIYGYSEMACRLSEELQDSFINIVCYFDKESRWTEDGMRTIQVENFHSSVDIVVITSFYYSNEIKKMLNKNNIFNVVTIKEIVDDLIKKL